MDIFSQKEAFFASKYGLLLQNLGEIV